MTPARMGRRCRSGSSALLRSGRRPSSAARSDQRVVDADERLAMNEKSISDVPLYTNLDRIARGLSAHGIGANDAIPPDQLFNLDQWHYYGIDAIRAAADQLGLGSTSHVLDIGSGVGGPARYLAHAVGCRVTALELQPKLNAIAVDLTHRSGLNGRITHILGDALDSVCKRAVRRGGQLAGHSPHP